MSLMLPPNYLMAAIGSVDSESFQRTGNEFLKYLIELAKLKPSESVLDVGCGVGRIALPLTSYLSDGCYEGFDILSECITWCKENITPQYPKFHFRYVDVFSKHYNRCGKYQQSEFVFPYDDCSFDLVVLTSVFTHMLPCDLEHYLYEISRILRPGGRCLITYFLAEEIQQIQNTRNFLRALGPMMPIQARYYISKMAKILKLYGDLNFTYPLTDFCFAETKYDKEGALAYKENYLRDLYKKYSLNITAICYGSWSGRQDHTSYQDIIIASKPHDSVVP